MEEIIANLRIKYSWLTEQEITALANNALGWYYSLRYPCEPTATISTRPINTFMDSWSVERICDEIAQRNGFNTSLGYRENGIQFTFDSAWISEALRKAIVPIVGVV
jgi:hypothetical protein